MKRIPCILLLFAFMMAGTSSLFAQTALEGERSTIFDALQRSGLGKGEVVINQSAAIREMVGERMRGANVETTDSLTFLKVQGYRTQVFSGNNQRVSKDEAFRKEKEIKELFPEIPTYVTYNAPFWKLRVGDFRSHEEAYHMMRLLMGAFPKYGKEMCIVRRYFPVITNGSRKTRLFVRRRKSRSFFQRSRRMSLTTPRFGSCVWEISARMRRPII